jgi:hypothetical protein
MAAAAIVLAGTTLPVVAQSLTASLSGRVTDESGGALPGATVTITSADTNVTAWTGPTDGEGAYLAPSLPVGRYNIAASLAGFKSKTITGVPLTVGQKANIPIELPAGAIAETINVVGEGLGRLETEDSAMGIVIDTTQVQNLPLPSRNVLNLLTLAGGVSGGSAASASMNASQLSINGSRTLNSEFNIDGVSAVSGSTGGVQRFPSTEAIREFKVQTAGYSAEFGRSAGGFVNVVIHSGANELHGGVYEYHRNERFNANDFFRNHAYQFLTPANQARCDNEPDNRLLDVTCGRRAKDRFNQFGAKLSGPVRIPGLYNGTDKTFFFVNYEARRQQVPSAPQSSVPDAAFRAGDFSGAPVTVNDPLTGQPFPGNRIPANRIDPAARRILDLVPLPNTSGTPDAANGRTTNNYINDTFTKPTDDEVTLRLDHHAGGKARLSARMTYYDLFGPSAPNIPGPLNNSVGDSFTKGWQATGAWNHVWSASLLTDVHVGYYRNDPVIDPPSAGMDVSGSYGIARSVYAASPRFQIQGWRNLGIDANTLRRQLDKNLHLSAATTWVHGSHTTKFGGQYRSNNFDVFNPGDAFTGVYNFTGEITSPTRAANNPVQAMADFLLGQVKTSFYELPQPRTIRQNYNVGVFVQDDWKLSSRFTANLGLRWEYESPMVIANDIHSRMDIRPDRIGQLLVASKNSSRSTDLEGDALNFAPRVGFAFTLNDKTVLRSAFGIFYGQIFSNLGGVVTYPGFTVRQDFNNLGAGVAQPFRLNEGMPLTAVQNLDDPFFVERGTSAARPLSVQGSGNNQYGTVSPLPYSMQWNFGIQRQLPGGAILDVSYIGSRGKNLPVPRNFNAVPLEQTQAVVLAGTTLAAQQARPNPNVTAFSAFVHEGDSWYHSGQARLARKFSERFSFQGTYTFSKSIDTGSGVFNFSQPQGLDVGDLAGAPGVSENHNRGLSAFDRPHIFALAAQYQTGGPWLVRGFQANVIVTARSGLTDTIAQTNLADWNIMPVLPGASSLQQRPNVKAGMSTDVKVPQSDVGANIRYLMPTNDPNFPFTPSGPFATGSGATRRIVVPFTGPGTLGRSTVRGPSEFNVDVALARRFDLKGRLGLTIRAEAFNALNHTNLNNADANLTVAADAAGNAIFNSPNFGLITSAKAPRIVQLVARLDF